MSLHIRALDANDTTPFIKAQWLFYKGDPNWVPPLIMDRKKLLNQKVNPFYRHAELQMFLAERNGAVVGRIAAITNERHNELHQDTIGFFGFFECINDQSVANALFDAAKAWLRKKGKAAIRGPVNPSMNDETGLLVDGFDGPPVILMTYNPPYYQDLIKGAGLDKVKDLYAYMVYTEDWQNEKLARMSDIVKERNGVTFRNLNLTDKAQFRRDVETLRDIYNTAWEKNWGFVKMTNEEFDFLAADLKQIANPEYAFIAESHGKVAGFLLAVPDVNFCFRHNKSGGLLTGLYHLLTKRKKIRLIRLIVLGVLPEFRRTGIDGALYTEIARRAKRDNLIGAEASWILEDNEMMNRGLTHTMKGQLYRTYRLFESQL
ncbi:MAG: GNAT family N-acetyltransferase [Candidatus Kapabacteria bacterium]|nr:GNAT family N-acetyltransferase [Candidatus Kapabacteria bacterium]